KTRQVCKKHERGGSANLRGRKVKSHRLADSARSQGARARWLGELARQESKIAQTRQGCKRHERGGSANLRCKKVHSNGVSRPRKVARGTSEVARRTCDARKYTRTGLADPARLQEARARWSGELAVKESKVARVSRPGKVARGASEVARRTCDARNSKNLRCKRVNSHGLGDLARLQEARGRWLGELAAQESKLARVSRSGKVARSTGEVARRTCEVGK
ncbi:hypothetical protein CRG98_044102, partial [Punica granatum]